MTIKTPTFAFAIKYKRSPKTINHALWLAGLETSLELVPSLKIEGFNTPHTSAKEIKVSDMLIRTEEAYVEAGHYETKETDVILVGVSNKFDISFGNLADYKLHSLLPIYSLPVLSLEDDIDSIISKLAAFTAYKAGIARKKRTSVCTTVSYHSNFVRVGNSRIDYDDTEALKALLKTKKAPKKEKAVEVPYILKNIFTLK